MAVQPIVDLRDGTVHAYEALARFGQGGTDSPLHWFSLAEEFGERDELERSCLRAALTLLGPRPRARAWPSTSPRLCSWTRAPYGFLEQPRDLSGLIIEVTEEALVQSEAQLHTTIAPLRERGARLAVDDMGAGYSGLRQITTVQPSYLKLDRFLGQWHRRRQRPRGARAGARRLRRARRQPARCRGHRASRGAPGTAGSRGAAREGLLPGAPC